MMKLELNFGIYQSEVYVEFPLTNKPTSEIIREIRGYASEFKTECILSRKPYNIPHFINWMNKYTSYRVTKDLPVVARIDF